MKRIILYSFLLETGPKTKGFTLIELMIAVAIIGILAGIALPEFAGTIRKSREATTKGNLAVLRSALSIYYGDNDGIYPLDDLTSLTVSGKYLTGIPLKSTPPYHPDGRTVSAGNDAAQSDSRGDWFYWNVRSDTKWGQIVINCVHEDMKGTVWTAY